jgi:hypothetical protein
VISLARIWTTHRQDRRPTSSIEPDESEPVNLSAEGAGDEILGGVRPGIFG